MMALTAFNTHNSSSLLLRSNQSNNYFLDRSSTSPKHPSSIFSSETPRLYDHTRKISLRKLHERLIRSAYGTHHPAIESAQESASSFISSSINTIVSATENFEKTTEQFVESQNVIEMETSINNLINPLIENVESFNTSISLELKPPNNGLILSLFDNFYNWIYNNLLNFWKSIEIFPDSQIQTILFYFVLFVLLTALANQPRE